MSHEPFIRQGDCGSSVHEHAAPHSPHGAFHNRVLDLGDRMTTTGKARIVCRLFSLAGVAVEGAVSL
ncbi:hypothetical protein T03_14860 [Trichinella britovi]|uniref:Uncharacterized protein n=1 Tax=Trichinella britovi TaxID=45882 RepID=A0A0V1AL79_TRIBR|nr:hypothetical protein T03_14860 [Trichinella britovi]